MMFQGATNGISPSFRLNPVRLLLNLHWFRLLTPVLALVALVAVCNLYRFAAKCRKQLNRIPGVDDIILG